MRLLFICITTFVLFGNLLLGQTSGYSVGVSGYYGIGILRQSLGKSGPIETHNYYTVDNQTPVLASLGKGFGINAYVSKELKNHLGYGVAIYYHKGSQISFLSAISSNQFWNGNYSNTTTESTTSYSKISQVQINPFIKISISDTTVKAYLKFGILLGCLGRTAIEYNTTTITSYSIPPQMKDTTVTHAEHSLTNYKGGVAFGFLSAIGWNIVLTRNLQLTTEGSLNFMQWEPAKMKQSTNGNYEDVENIRWPCSSVKFTIGLAYLL